MAEFYFCLVVSMVFIIFGVPVVSISREETREKLALAARRAVTKAKRACRKAGRKVVGLLPWAPGGHLHFEDHLGGAWHRH